MDHPPLPTQTSDRPHARSQWLGLGIVAFGTLALLEVHQVFNVPLLATFWPLVLLISGLERLIRHRDTGGWLPGAVLLFLGGVMLARNLGLTDVGLHQLWPVFIILGGLSMLRKGDKRRTSR